MCCDKPPYLKLLDNKVNNHLGGGRVPITESNGGRGAEGTKAVAVYRPTKLKKVRE
jgi:hypothetical protein